MSKIYVVAGLGFGDEGKGTITEYLTAREGAHTIVRYNGGAQAAHNVVMADGRHHTFSQFGSGTLHGAATHLSRFMIIDPMAMKKEAEALRDLGISNPFDMLTVERGALLITPYQKGANRLREFLRANGRHGSCGVGVGETMSDYLIHGDAVPKIEDLFSPALLGDKLAFIRDLKLKEFSRKNLTSDPTKNVGDVFNMLTAPVEYVLELWHEVAVRLVDKGYLQEVLNKEGHVIFEGAQGMLLDQTWGFHPHTTWTDISFNNADTLIDELDPGEYDIEKIGVIRTYLTRHGAGPFPTEIRQESIEANPFFEKFNQAHEWQGSFRKGYFDMMLLKYALDAIGPIDSLALTHVDVLPHLKKMCISYDPTSPGLEEFVVDDRLLKLDHEDLGHQRRLGYALKSGTIRCNYWPVNRDFVDVIEDMADVKVSILSSGPTLQDKIRQ